MGKRALFRNIIGPNSENSKFWVKNWYLRSKCNVRIEVNTDNACKSRWHFGRSTGLAKCAKKSMHASVDLPPDGHIVQHFWCCNLSKCCRFVHFFQWNESERVVLPIVIIWHSVSLDFRSTKRALFEVLSTKSSTKRRKNEGRWKH